MSERQTRPYDGIARKWLALVERRQAYFVELCRSERWRHYYTQAELLDEMHRVLRVRDRWATIAGLSPENMDRPPQTAELSAAMPTPRWPD
jgi:hypothetical protein